MAAKPSINTKTHLRDILLLIAIPVGLLIVAASYVYIPQILARPQHDFLYTTCNSSYRCLDSYTIGADDRIRYIKDIDDDLYYASTSRLYYYDVSEDSSREIPTNQVNDYQLDTSSRSTDGYTLVHENGSSSGMFLFYSSQKDGWYLKNGIYKKPVTLPDNSGYYSSGDIQFLGWIK